MALFKKSKEPILNDRLKKTRWHCLLAHILKELLQPVGIQVLTEVQVSAAPQQADMLLLRRKGKSWTQAQLACLADGLRDTDAKLLLIEFKYTESITENALKTLFSYDVTYRNSEKLKQDQLQSFLISSKTPRTDVLTRLGFKETKQKGVYVSDKIWVSSVRVILLNELDDKPNNAAIKCFSSRQHEKNKAFDTMTKYYLQSNQPSRALRWAITGLLRVMMSKPEVTGWTPEEIVQLGREWFEAKAIEFSHQIGHKEGHQEGHQEGRQEEAANLLLRQLPHRFGKLPKWAKNKITQADLATLEKWSLQLLDAQSLKAVFK